MTTMIELGADGFRELVEMSQDLHFQCDADGRYTYLNPAWETVFGYTLEEMLGKKFSDFQTKEQAAKDLIQHQQLLKGELINGLETVHTGKTGKSIFLTFFAKPVRDASGLVIGTRGTAHNKSDLIRNVTKYRTLFESNRDAIMVENTEHFLDCNQATLEMFGVPSVEEFCKLHPSHLSGDNQENSRQSFEVANQLVQEAIAKGKCHFEWLSRRLDNGQIFPTEVLLSKMTVDGEPIILASVRDISERRNIQAKLQAEQLFTEKMLSSLPGIFYLYTYPELRLVRWNKNHETLLGFEHDELLNRSIMEWHPPENKPLVKQAIDLAMEKGINALESSLLHKNGNLIPFLMTGLRLDTPDQSYLMGIGIDITDRKKMENQLRESEERFSTLFQSMTEMVAIHELVFDDQGAPINYKVIACNSAFTRITGISAEQAIGKLASDVYGISPAPYLQEFSHVALTGESYEYSAYYKPMDKYFSISVVSPKKNTFATITTDVTEIRRVQEIINEKNKELENYLYVASHDLRAPLVNLQGFSQKLEADLQSLSSILQTMNCKESETLNLGQLISEEFPKSIKYIRSSTSKMDALINGLLRISRTGRSEMKVESIDMEHLMNSIINTLSFQLEEADAKIELGPLPNCYGDKELLNQLFTNLISNAIKYRAPMRPLRINISAEEDFNYVRFMIEDNGIGIEERHLHKIWDVFFRVNFNMKDSGEGLGLSIVKRLAEKHFGKVWATSELGKGSAFFVELLRKPFTPEPSGETK